MYHGRNEQHHNVKDYTCKDEDEPLHGINLVPCLFVSFFSVFLCHLRSNSPQSVVHMKHCLS
jgi:hypothetical protein